MSDSEMAGPEIPSRHLCNSEISFSRVKVAGKAIALTFDDGPHPKNTLRLLEILRARGIKATFYVIGSNVERYPEVLRRTIAEGHEIGNHTHTHCRLSELGDAELLTELRRCRDAIRTAAGIEPRTMRPPYGTLLPHQREKVNAELGYPTILWSVDPRDWQKPGPEAICSRIVSGVSAGGIVLAHDPHDGTVDAMPATLDSLIELGYEFVTVSELLAMRLSRGPMPEMAVVVLSVGAPPELGRAVASILDQNTKVELVVVNSGGGDVQARLPGGEHGIKVLSFETILGPGEARNRGIKASEAPFIAFLAADCVAEGNWVAARLRRHREGAEVVASSVVNSHPRSVVAWASHLALFSRRLPGTPAEFAVKYGASYSRHLFHHHGLFDDIRIGEDTEFHERIGPDIVPRWAPEVQTVHANPTSLIAAWRDQYRRGIRSGKFWPQNHMGRTLYRSWRKFRSIFQILEISLHGYERSIAHFSLPLIGLNLLIYELGATRGKRRPDPVSIQHRKACEAIKSKCWQSAHAAWVEADRLAPGRIAPLMGRAKALMKMNRFSEAERVFEELLRHSPELIAGHQGMAIAAGKIGQWEGALAAWSTVERLMPGKPGPKLGLGMALLELHRIDEAQAVFALLSKAFPEHPGGNRGMAAVAMLRCDWSLALVIYENLWTGFGDVEAVRKKVVLLTGLDRFSEAEAVLESLRSPAVKPIIHLNAALAFLEAKHDWSAIMKLLERNQQGLRDHIGLLQRYVNALSMLGRAGEALPMIRHSRAGAANSRETLLLTALLRDRQYNEAGKYLERIWSNKRVGEIPVFLHSSMVTAALEKGGPELAIRVLNRIEVKAPLNSNGNGLRMLGIFHRARLKRLAGLASPDCLHPANPPFESQIIKILAWDSRQISPSNGASIQEITDEFVRWRKTHPAFFPDPSFVLRDALEVAFRIIQAVDAHQPFALLRLGDGEGNLLPYRKPWEAFSEGDRAATQRSWWGHRAPEDHDIALPDTLCDAIRVADVVGIPDLHRVCGVMGSDPVMTLTANGKNARGLLAILDFISRSSRSPSQVLTSCHIHQSLSYWGLWDILLPQMGPVSLITCHGELAEILATRHGIPIEGVHLIPSEQKFSDIFKNTVMGRHYPDFYQDLQGKLSGVRRGQVFLVAAGMLGKIYCKWIKEAGGIAIDVGSAVDFWCGYETRGLNEVSNYRGPTDMAQRLEHLADHDSRLARLVRPISQKVPSNKLPTAAV